MKKRESKRNLRLRSLLIILLICAVVFISSTYAWFTSNKEVSIDTITVNVKTSAGIQISADGVNWKSSLSLSDIQTAASTYSALIDVIPTYVEPVSTDMTLAGNGTLNMFYGQVISNEAGGFSLFANADAPSSTAHYVVFDVFLKTTTALGEGKVKIDCSNADAAERSGINITSGTESSLGIQNAARVAFIKLGNIADGSTTAQIQALGSENAGSSPKILWEPNADAHTAAAIAHASSTYGITTTASDDPIAYDGVKAAILEANAIPLAETNATDNSTYFAAVTPTYSTATSDRNDLNFFTLDAGITRVRVYMWIEGQDVDCENNASGASLDLNLKLKLVD